MLTSCFPIKDITPRDVDRSAEDEESVVLKKIKRKKNKKKKNVAENRLQSFSNHFYSHMQNIIIQHFA